MKKKFIYGFMACLSLAFVACGSDSDSDGGSSSSNNSRTTTPPTYQQESNATVAKKYKTERGDIEFYGSGKYSAPKALFAGSLSARRQAAVDEVSMTSSDALEVGTFTASDGSYRLKNGYVITPESGNLKLVSPDFSEEKIRVEKEEEPAVVSNSFTAALCRTWNFKKTRITVDYDGNNVGKEWNGFNPGEIAKDIIEKGVNFEEKYDSKKLTNVIFSPFGTIMFTYDDGSVDYGTFTISGNNVRYTWNGKSKFFKTENGQMLIEWEGSTMVLSFTSDFTTDKTVYHAKMTWWVTFS